jgi:hypothetical protein
MIAFRGERPMSPRKSFRLAAWLVLLGGALMTSGCTNAQVGVGFGVAVPAPWGGVSVGTSTGWYGGPRWYP